MLVLNTPVTENNVQSWKHELIDLNYKEHIKMSDAILTEALF